jgi:signal transduction histidine kinase
VSLPRPLNFLLLCLGLLLLQQALSSFVAWTLWSRAGPLMHGTWVLVLSTGTVHLVLLLVQLPRAMRWRQRRSVRPSTELRQERQRIARDLHDRVGSQLVNALALFDPAKETDALQRAALEHALLELRLLVDAMGDPDRTLVDQLAQLRYRLQPVLARQGIAIEWEVGAASLPDAPRDPLLAVIAQEALSNVIQHAQATRVRVSLNRLPGSNTWQFEVCDNGRGLPQASADNAPQGGFGMSSMRERVRQAGGELQFLPSALGGTCLRVVLARRL